MRHGSSIGATPSATAAALALLLMLPATRAADDVVATNTRPDLAEAQARYQSVPREYRLDGVVEAINRTTVSAQTQGQVEAIFYDVDDLVNEGDLLARLRGNEHRTRVAQAAADLKSATAQLQQARDEFGRVQGLYEKKNVSDSAMDQARADLTSAQAHLEAAQAGLQQAQEQLQYTQIRAPYSGIVTERHVEVGEIASPGRAVMSGISLEELRVIVDVPQSVIPAVRELGEINIYLPSGEVAKPGRITVFPFADLGSNTFKVRVDLTERTEGLFPGMFVKTGIITGKKNELTVPAAAVVYRSEVTGVYVLSEDGNIRLRQIRVGRALGGNRRDDRRGDRGDDLVVLSGLTEGERVALDPIAAGVALKARAQARVAARGHGDD